MNKAGAMLGAVAVMAARAAFGMLRFGLYVVMLIAARVVAPVLSLFVGMGTLVFIVTLVMRNFSTPMLAGALLAFGSMACLVIFNAVLQALAPEGTVIISEM